MTATTSPPTGDGPGRTPSTLAPAAAVDGAAETRRSTRSGVAGLLGAATSGLFGFVLAVVITRGYGTTGAGAFFAAIGVVTVAAAICTLGAETGLIWALPRRRPGDGARVLPVALTPPLLFAVLVAVGGAVVAGPLAGRLLGPAGGPLLVVTFAAVPVVVAMNLLLAVVRCVRPMRSYVSVQFLLLPIARPLLVGAAVLAGGGLLAGMTGWLVPAAVALLVCLILVAGPLGIGAGARLRPQTGDWSTFWRFALPRAASAAIDAGSMWIGVLLTSALASPADAGVFGAVGRYVLAGQLAMQGLRVAVAPQLSRLLGRGERAAAAAVHRQLTSWGLVLSWPVYLLLAVFAPAFLALFGPEFTTGAAAMTVLAVAMLVNTGVGNVQSLLLMGGHSGLHLAGALAGLLVTVGGGLALIPDHGATGAAVAWAAGIVTENLCAATFARLVVRQPLVDARMLASAAATVAGVGLAAVAGLAVAGRGIAGLVLAVATLAIVCVGLLTLSRVRRGIRVTMVQIRGGGGGGAPPRHGRRRAGEFVVSSIRDRVKQLVPTQVTNRVRESLVDYGVRTSDRRPLPDFLIIGTKRGGTTSLWNYLIQHPLVPRLFPAWNTKSSHYFEEHWHRGEAWYRSHFPTLRQREALENRHGGPVRVGEAAPLYMFHPLAAERVSALMPSVRLIVLLRDPVERAYSHWKERRTNGVEPLDFAAALAAEAERTAGERDRLIAEPNYFSEPYDWYTYRARGRYLEHLQPWLERFDRSQILFLPSEELYRDARATYRRTLDFLGLPPFDLPNFKVYNDRRSAPLEPALRAELTAYYRPHNEALRQRLGLRLDWPDRVA